MRKFKLFLVIFGIGIFSLWGSPVITHAATVNLYPAITVYDFYWSDTGRTTLFQAREDVTVNQVGVLLDPRQSSLTLEFRVYKADASGVLIGVPLYTASNTYTDNGLGLYGVAFDASLSKDAYYTLYVKRVAGTADFSYVREGSAALPYQTPEGYFSVMDGGHWNGSGPVEGNSYLPAFTVDASKTSTVPLPGALLLLGPGLLALNALKKRAKQ